MCTKPEKMVRNILNHIGFETKFFRENNPLDPSNTIYMQTPFSGMRLDFALMRPKIAIEINGNYWHGLYSNKLSPRQVNRKINDAKKSSQLYNEGWHLISLSASSVTDRPNRTSEYLLEQILTGFTV